MSNKYTDKELDRKTNELIRLRREFQNVTSCRQKNWSEQDWDGWDRFYAENKRRIGK